jgi:hypothetical protein
MLFLATKFVSLIGILVKLPLALDVIKIVLGVFLGVIGSRFVGSFMGNLRTKDLDSESKQRAVTLGKSYGKHSQQGIRAESWIEVDTDTATHYIMIANYRATSLIIQTSSRIIDHGITYEGDTTDWHRQSILPPATRHRWMPASATWLKSGMPLVISTSHQAGQATFEVEVRYELGRGSEQFNRIMLVLKV